MLGDKQADTLLALGVPAYSIIVGHIDKNADPYVHRDLAARGVFLQYDSPSRLKYGPDADAASLIAAAAQHGYLDQILLGMDLARRSYYPSYGGGPGLRICSPPSPHDWKPRAWATLFGKSSSTIRRAPLPWRRQIMRARR